MGMGMGSATDADDRLWLFYVFTKQVKEDTIVAEYNGPLDAVDAYTHSVGYDILLSNVVLVACGHPILGLIRSLTSLYLGSIADMSTKSMKQ